VCEHRLGREHVVRPLDNHQAARAESVAVSFLAAVGERDTCARPRAPVCDAAALFAAAAAQHEQLVSQERSGVQRRAILLRAGPRRRHGMHQARVEMGVGARVAREAGIKRRGAAPVQARQRLEV
jgi:hypothetical protein